MRKESTVHRSNGIRSDGAVSEAPSDLELPSVPDVDNTGTRLVRRVVSLTFVVLGAVVGLALLVGSLVSIDTTIDAQGTLEPTSRRTVRALQSGSIVDVFVAPGERVGEGEVLAKLDSLQLKSELVRLRSEYQTLALEQKNASLSSALEQKQRTYSRQQAQSDLLRARADLREQLAIHGYDYKASVDSILAVYTPGTHIAIDRALAAVRSAKAQEQSAAVEKERVSLTRIDQQIRRAELQRIQRQIEILKEQLSRRIIRSPYAGVVVTDRTEDMIGRYVREGEALFEVAKMDRWHAELLVEERQVSDIQVGDSAKVEIQAFQDETKELVYGVVNSVAVEPFVPQSRGESPSVPSGTSPRYRVTVQLNQEQVQQVSRGDLKYGYSVTGKIITNSGRITHLLWDYLTSRSTAR